MRVVTQRAVLLTLLLACSTVFTAAQEVDNGQHPSNGVQPTTPSDKAEQEGTAPEQSSISYVEVKQKIAEIPGVQVAGVQSSAGPQQSGIQAQKGVGVDGARGQHKAARPAGVEDDADVWYDVAEDAADGASSMADAEVPSPSVPNTGAAAAARISTGTILSMPEIKATSSNTAPTVVVPAKIGSSTGEPVPSTPSPVGAKNDEEEDEVEDDDSIDVKDTQDAAPIFEFEPSPAVEPLADLAECQQWRNDTVNQGVTAGDRPAPELNVFSELTIEEYTTVLKFLLSQPDLELHDLAVNVTGSETVLNYVHSIVMEMPPKSDVLATLDENEPMPPRKARAVLVLGKANPPSVKEVLVTVTYVNGSAVASHLQSSNIQSSKWESLPYYQRPMGLLDDAGVANALDEVEDKLNEFLMSALDGFSYGGACEVTEKCIEWTITHCQHINKDIPRGTYVQFYWRTIVSDGNYLHPIPLQMLIAGKGKHLKTWYVFKVWFNGNWYDSVEELLQAWKKNTYGLRDNFKFVFPDAAQSLFANFEPRPGPKRGVEQPVGPLAWEPYGRRFTITGGNRVDWLGWSLYVGYTPSFGPRYWDLRFKGERIAYEISMQEAMAKYGADDLTQANAVFLDSAFGLGYNLRELMQGVDCPMTAAFMDATIFHGGMTKPQTFKNAICIFEQNPDTPVLRHYSSAFQFYGAVPGAKLVVRMISTVYNYDYIQDLLLNVDGTVDVKVVTSGYILATTSKNFYPKHFGYPVFYNVSGTVHTHVLAWKADIDIAGTANSVKLHNLKLTQADNGAGGKIYMQKYDSKTCKKEEDSAFVSVVYEPKIPVVVNEDEPNSWGSPRGYKVQFNKLIANLEPPEYERSKGLGFWKWNFVATKYKDGETHSSSPYNQIDLANPAVNLCDYVDGDSIRRKDVVVWINSGLYHIPISEDAPSTATSGNELGFSLIPFNWADANSATDMVNMVQFTPNNTNNTSTFINEAANKCSPSYTQVPFLKDGFAADEDEDAAVPYRDNMSYEPEQDSEGLMSVATAAATKTAAAKPAQSAAADPAALAGGCAELGEAAYRDGDGRVGVDGGWVG